MRFQHRDLVAIDAIFERGVFSGVTSGRWWLVRLVKVTRVGQPIKRIRNVQQAVDIGALGVPRRHVLDIGPRGENGIRNTSWTDFSARRKKSRVIGRQCDRIRAYLTCNFVDLNSVVAAVYRGWSKESKAAPGEKMLVMEFYAAAGIKCIAKTYSESSKAVPEIEP